MKKIIWFIIIVIIAAAGWYLASPLFIDREVNEAFPGEESGSSTSIVIPSDEELAAMAPEAREELRIELEEEAAALPDTVMTESMPAAAETASPSGPVRVALGNFRDADSFHRGSGTAGIYMLEDGSHIARFEDFDVTNGPDLRVLLSKNANDVVDGEYVELGRLKGNRGNQNYEIPDGIDVGEYESVIIYCKPFHVIFSIAEF